MYMDKQERDDEFPGAPEIALADAGNQRCRRFSDVTLATA